MLARIFIALALALGYAAAGSQRASAQVLSEAEIIRLARTRDPETLVAHAAAAASAAREVEAGVYPNPAVAWEREHVPGDGPLAEREDAFVLRIPLEFSGRIAARRALSRSETAQARASEARTRSDAVLRALSSFYVALAAQRSAHIARETAARLEEAARVLGRRVEEGTASGYEHVRVELETELARSELREAEAHAAIAAAELALLLGLAPASIELRGDLELVAPAAAPPVQIGPRRSAAFARSAAREAQKAQDSAASAWIPALEASGGLRSVGAQGDTAYGYVAGMSIELPVFSRGQDVRALAGARERLANAQAEALDRDAAREAARAALELTLARSELERLDAATRDRLQQLATAAASAYREGQRTLLELLDTERTRAAIERRKLQLALAAKRAEAALRAARGEFE